jgi:ketosteroid isomerase-like protein
MMTDEQQIRALTERYFYALDTRQLDHLTECFTPDASISIQGAERRLAGYDDLVGAFSGVMSFAHTRHLVTSEHVEVAGSGASAHTLAVAIVLDGNGAVHVRGVDYRDELVRTAAGWRIVHRRHNAYWQFDADSTPLFLSGASWEAAP